MDQCPAASRPWIVPIHCRHVRLLLRPVIRITKRLSAGKLSQVVGIFLFLFFKAYVVVTIRFVFRCRSNASGNRPGRTSLSVLSPFDEAEEWTKILEILNSCNSGLESSEDVGDGSHLLGAVQREFQNRLGEFTQFPPCPTTTTTTQYSIGSSYISISVTARSAARLTDLNGSNFHLQLKTEKKSGGETGKFPSSLKESDETREYVLPF